MGQAICDEGVLVSYGSMSYRHRPSIGAAAQNGALLEIKQASAIARGGWGAHFRVQRRRLLPELPSTCLRGEPAGSPLAGARA
jgi:hypothetical protein